MKTKSPKTTKTHVNKFDAQITASNLRIKSSIQTLSAHERGLAVLKHFRAFCEQSGVNGLDMSGQSALITLTKEFTFGGRRDFVSELPKMKATQVEYINTLEAVVAMVDDEGDLNSSEQLHNIRSLCLNRLGR